MFKSCRSSRWFSQYWKWRRNLKTRYLCRQKNIIRSTMLWEYFHLHFTARAKFDIHLTGFRLAKSNMLASQYHWETNVVSDLTARWIVPTPKTTTGAQTKFIIVLYVFQNIIYSWFTLCHWHSCLSFYPGTNTFFFPKNTHKRLVRNRSIIKHVIGLAVFCASNNFWDLSVSEICH